MNQFGRVVGIDYGTRRVGIAIADPLDLFAQPHGTFSPDESVTVLVEIAAREGIRTVIIGWPVDPEGEEGEMTERVQQYINRIRKKLPATEVVKWDETYSSASAEELLRASGAKRKKRREKGVIDRLAASIILQEYLDTNN